MKSQQCNILPEVQNSAAGTRTRVARVKAEYPNQLDYSGDANVMQTKELYQPMCMQSQ